MKSINILEPARNTTIAIPLNYKLHIKLEINQKLHQNTQFLVEKNVKKY